jgi:hypothetical protein
VTLQNFRDRQLPVVSADWLNSVDQIKVTYDRTAAEEATGVIPTNTGYPEGHVFRYGATGDGVTSDSAAIQKAINVGKTVYFPDGIFQCSGLTSTTNIQAFVGTGSSILRKNASGAIFTSAANDLVFQGMQFRGASASFTGDNVVLTGDRPTLLNCASSDASGRALKATGGRVRVLGSCGIYQTADATASGYDIEVGVSGTATLYHVLTDFNSSQSTGGILLIDCGSQVVCGCQFGKLTIQVGTGPAGVNGGMTIGNRILGDISVGFANATLSANQFGSSTDITFQLGTSGCRLDDSNTYSNTTTVTNLGNANNYICREVSTGSTIDIKYGDDSSAVVIKYDPSTGLMTLPYSMVIPNNRAYRFTGSGGGTSDAQLTLSAADIMQIVNAVAAKSIQLAQTGAGSIQLLVNAAESLRVDSSTTAGQTRLLIYDVDNGTLERVTVGAADSGGAGFKLLRIPN